MTAQLTSGFVQKPVFREKFPVKRPLSGNYSGDRFVSDCAHHHPVSTNRTFPARRQIGRFCGHSRRLKSRILVSVGVRAFWWRLLAPCLCIQKFRSRRPWLSAEVRTRLKPYSGFGAAVIRDLGPGLILFRIESERVKLPNPFGRRIAEPLEADAAGQATFYGRF